MEIESDLTKTEHPQAKPSPNEMKSELRRKGWHPALFRQDHLTPPWGGAAYPLEEAYETMLKSIDL